MKFPIEDPIEFHWVLDAARLVGGLCDAGSTPEFLKRLELLLAEKKGAARLRHAMKRLADFTRVIRALKCTVELPNGNSAGPTD